MEPKTNKTAGSVSTELDAVTWVRSVRDAMYERTKAMSREDFSAYVARAAATVSNKAEGYATLVRSDPQPLPDSPPSAPSSSSSVPRPLSSRHLPPMPS